MKASLHENWNYYCNWLKSRLPQYHQLLNKGASETEIQVLKNAIPFELPKDLILLLRLNNGDHFKLRKDLYQGSFLGFEFLSVQSIIEIHEDWKNYVFEDYFGESFPENCIKPDYTNSGWIPLFSDMSGNYIGIDLDPDEEGSVGQIINFGRDEDRKFVIAESLGEFLDYIADKIESGELDESIMMEDDGTVSYGLTPQSHLIEDLRAEFGGE
jgi:cell wall assembly regulator SMI1